MSDIRALHPLIAQIGKEVHARRIPYAELSALLGGVWGDGAIGGWLRGTRHPTIGAVDRLAGVVGLELGAYPKGTNVSALIAEVDALRAENVRLLRYVARHAIKVDESTLRSAA
jgi:hypothetical protein